MEAAKINKVLIVNDSGFERMVLRDQVRMLGYEVKTADEITSLSIINGYHPDIVIANLTMGDISGDKLIAHIKSNYPGIRCFLSSCSKINSDMIDKNIIDGVIETPATNTMLEKVLNNTSFVRNESDSFSALEIESTDDQILKTEAGKRTCPSCLKETGIEFAFCPFCGIHL